MKKLFFLILSLFLISSCNLSSNDSFDRIKAPEIIESPIKGTWSVKGIYDGALKDEEAAVFDKDKAALLNNYFEEVTYSARYIRGKDAVSLDFSDSDLIRKRYNNNDLIKIITLKTKDNVQFDFYNLEDGLLMSNIDGRTYILKREKVEADGSYLKMLKEKSSDKITNEIMGNDRSSGLVIGLKKKNKGNSSYRTIFIASENMKLKDSLEYQGLIFPRRSGFYKLEILHDYNNEEDLIYSYSIGTENKVEYEEPISAEKEKQKSALRVKREIEYIGNDYISIENKIIDNEGKLYDSFLNIQPIDYLPYTQGISIGDIAGKTGLEVLNKSREEFVKNNDKNLLKESRNIDENIGLMRKWGHWLYKGRISYRDGENLEYSDYIINVIPSSKIVYYDDLNVTYKDVLYRVPEAKDVFTSPVKDIAAVVLDKEILIYGIEGKALSKEPLQRIPLDDETVIMAEWATGDYTNNWYDVFIDEGARKIK